MHKILFVCTGNICRSPTAEGVLRHYLGREGLADAITVDSAGTHGYHIGEAPDSRSIAAARKRGVSIDGLRARKVEKNDFHHFDLILGLDRGHVDWLKRAAPANAKADIALCLEYAGNGGEKEVPDPYYGNAEGFEHVLDLLEAAMPEIITKLRTGHA